MRLPIKWPSGLIDHVEITRDGDKVTIVLPMGKQRVELRADQVMSALMLHESVRANAQIEHHLSADATDNEPVQPSAEWAKDQQK